MIHGIIMTLFGLISLIGVVGYLLKNQSLSRGKKLSLSFFTFSHVCFLITDIMSWLTSVSPIVFISTVVLVFISRIINGLILYGKNNPRHYLVTGAILMLAFLLYLYCL
ncbi:hypothetical protein [Oceanobacillus picturae]|uniref:hypothetical protein n=1 Tax=Oceanobacillus picturae TaxID=171693 RepID=UPI00073D7ADE|nr:hypothetical protein [Oceanobacillus picturae]